MPFRFPSFQVQAQAALTYQQQIAATQEASRRQALWEKQNAAAAQHSYGAAAEVGSQGMDQMAFEVSKDFFFLSHFPWPVLNR